MKRPAVWLAMLAVFATVSAFGRVDRAAGTEASKIWLGARNVFTATSTASATVALAAPLRIRNPLANGTGIRISGQGAFVGFALVQQHTDEPHIYVGGRLPKEATGQIFFFDASGFFASSADDRYIRVEPGVYRLHVLPGNGAARIYMKGAGLEGRATVTASEPAQFQAQVLDNKVASNPVRYSSDAVATINGTGFVVGLAWVTTSLHAGTRADLCFWRGNPDAAFGNAPGCGDARALEPQNLRDQSATTDYGTSTEGSFRTYYGTYLHRAASQSNRTDLGLSISTETASVGAKLGALGLWLGLD